MTQLPDTPYDHYDNALNAANKLPDNNEIVDDITLALTSIAQSLLGMLKLNLEKL
jgi:hypothetical protein